MNLLPSDNLERRGFICKDSILNQVSQEEVFQLVLGYSPKEFDYIVSPFRKDKTPGCWFEYHTTGVLYFIDFADKKRTHRDCFNMVQDYFQLGNFYLTLEYIYNTLIRGKKIESLIVQKKVIEVVKPKVKILVEARNFSLPDSLFWSQYDIKKEDLIEDRVFPVKKVYALNTKKGTIISDCNDVAYSYNDFPDSRKKVYFPKREGKKRFLTNCTKDDIGGLTSLVPYGKELIITKSYKDYRVLKNSGKHVIWFQNEGMIPNDQILNQLVKHFLKVVVWYDNDQPGIEASEKVTNYINSLCPAKAKSLCLPERALSWGIKDPSDCKAKDPQLFNTFLKTFTV